MIKQHPFSLYDFLGYLIPGIIVTYLILLANNISEINNISDLISTVSEKQEFQIDKFIFFIIISYALGHLINYLSSITIEKFANWKYDYPSKYLININTTQKYFRKDIKGLKLFYRILLAIIILPVVFWDYFLGKHLKFNGFYTKQLDDFLIEVIKAKSLKLLDTLYPPDCSELKDKDYHRILSHYVYENSKNHQFKMTNYVSLYGFLRAICLICNFLFWIYLIYIIYNSSIFIKELDDFSFKIIYRSINYSQIIILTSVSFFTYIYFMAFMKFYRRYTLEAYMLIAIDKDILIDKKEHNE